MGIVPVFFVTDFNWLSDTTVIFIKGIRMSAKKEEGKVPQSQDLPKRMWLRLDTVREETKKTPNKNGINYGNLQKICDRCFGFDAPRAEVMVTKVTQGGLAICTAHCRGVNIETFVVLVDWLTPVGSATKKVAKKTSPSVRDILSVVQHA